MSVPWVGRPGGVSRTFVSRERVVAQIASLVHIAGDQMLIYYLYSQFVGVSMTIPR